ncbi:MAG: glycosyltransferase family 39 protein, partial [Candidatus Aminicenantes bacterium]|nr:glycosyltransferase family 39 protein [Candidatus Aminicenantes bacterium]
MIISSSFYFGFQRLENFSGVDEPLWSYDRVPKFWNAVSTHNWKKTNICDKPGVPLAIVSGAGLPFIENPKSYRYLRFEPKTPEQLQDIRDVYFFLRLPVFLFTLAILPLFYFLIKKLLGKNTARFSIIFIGLSPILLGISLIINSDAMLWILSALATLGLFTYLKERHRKYLILSGFFLGLSVITKYVANILFVYFFLIFLLEYLFHAHRKIPIAKYLKRALIDYLILAATAVGTAFIFFPATWVKFSVLWNATLGNDVFSSTWPLFVGVIGLLAVDALAFRSKFSAIIFGFFAKYKRIISAAVAVLFLAFCAFVFLHVWAGFNVYDLQSIIASPKGIGEGSVIYKYAGAISADFYSLLFSISPLVLVLILFST